MRSPFWLLAAGWMALPVWPGSCRAAAPDPAKVAAEIDRIMSQEYSAGEPGAAIMVSRTGQVILKKAYGLADLERKLPVAPDTVFRLASLTKAFTGTAVLMLAEQGKLDLEAPVAKYLPEFPAPGRDVRLRQLLSHTSGLAEYLDRPDSMEWARGEYTVAQLLDTFKLRPAAFAPGEKNVYSNSNYILLGAILEKVSGLGFGEYVKRNLLDALGMKSTFCDGSLTDVPRLATAYEPARTASGEPDWSRLVVARPYTMRALYAAGGCLASLEDMGRFTDALLKGELLREKMLERSFQPVVLNSGALANTAFGGWQLDRIGGRRAAMRGGALPGVCTWMILMPDDDVALVLLSNRPPGKPRCGMLAVRLAGVAVAQL